MKPSASSLHTWVLTISTCLCASFFGCSLDSPVSGDPQARDALLRALHTDLAALELAKHMQDNYSWDLKTCEMHRRPTMMGNEMILGMTCVHERPEVTATYTLMVSEDHPEEEPAAFILVQENGEHSTISKDPSGALVRVPVASEDVE